MPTYPWVQYLPLCMKLRYCLLKIATSLLNPHCFAPDGYQPWRTDCRFNCCWMILPTKSLIRAPSQPCHKLPELLRIGELPPNFFTVGTSSRQQSTKITVSLQPTYFCFHNNICINPVINPTLLRVRLPDLERYFFKWSNFSMVFGQIFQWFRQIFQWFVQNIGAMVNDDFDPLKET